MKHKNINRYIEETIQTRHTRCGHKDRQGYCSKKKIHIDCAECMDCWFYKGTVTMRNDEWNWTDGYLTEELSE